MSPVPDVRVQRILVVVDDPATCMEAFAWTERLASAFGAKVWVLRGVAGSGGGPDPLLEAERGLELALERAGLDRMGARPLVHTGSVLEHLPAAINLLGPDLVLMPRLVEGRNAADAVPTDGPALLLLSCGLTEGTALP